MNTRLALSSFACGLLVACVSPKSKSAAPRPQKATAPPPIQRATMTLEQIRREPAAVTVLQMQSIVLTVSPGKTGWLRVPEQFTKFRTRIFASEGRSSGVADYKVTQSGYLVAACNYDYQGNGSGGWEAESWTREQFYAHGWRELVPEVMGGPLVDGQNRQHVVFVKAVSAGESGRLRCNKYSPPYFILCSNALEP